MTHFIHYLLNDQVLGGKADGGINIVVNVTISTIHVCYYAVGGSGLFLHWFNLSIM